MFICCLLVFACLCLLRALLGFGFGVYVVLVGILVNSTVLRYSKLRLCLRIGCFWLW